MIKERVKGVVKKTKNVTIDEDLVELINKRADELLPKLGFRPTLSQTIRHLMMHQYIK